MTKEVSDMRREEKVFLLLGAIVLAFPLPIMAQEDVNVLKEEVKILQEKVNQLEKELSAYKSAPNTGSRLGLQQPFDNSSWDPFAEMENMQREINHLFDQSFGRGGRPGQGSGFLDHPLGFNPDFEMQETDKEYTVRVDIPGMDKSDIKVEVRDNNLVVSGDKKVDTSETQPNRFSREERSFGSFSRVISLPKDAKGNAFTTDYKDGVLTIRIPKEKEGNLSTSKI